MSGPSGDDVHQQHSRLHQYEANIHDYDDDYADESLEHICESALEMIAHHPNIDNLNPSLLLSYCPHFKDRLALVIENKNKTTNDHSDSNNDGEKKKKKKKRTLRKRQLKKQQFAFKFIRKSVPKI